uniref:Peptidase S1 domain-containing protein n=1 Tax=Chelydra serpentina TaxID=8475 RepID=A0A8C3SZA2_CHESE
PRQRRNFVAICIAVIGADSMSGNRIIGGRNCPFGSRPYQVALLRYGRVACGGSLIAPKWVLTAAHCEQIRRIRNVFVHPGYNRRPLDNDFMLLELDAPAQLNNYVNTINLATRCPSPGTRCVVSGWGTIRSPQRLSPAIMQCADLYSVSQARCQDIYRGRITENMFCAGVEQGGISTCKVRGPATITHQTHAPATPLLISPRHPGDVEWGGGSWPGWDWDGGAAVGPCLTKSWDWVKNV